MTCPECREQLAAYIEGLMDQSAAGRIELHLSGCPTCRAELDELRQLVGRLVCDGQAASEVSLDARVMDRIAGEQVLRLRRVKMNRIAKIAAAAVVVIGLYFGVPYLATDRDGSAALAAAREHMKKAKNVAFTYFAYEYDLETNRVKKDKRHVWFRDPGLMRRVGFNDDGTIEFIWIEDWAEGKKLLLYPDKKSALFYDKGRQTDPGRWDYKRVLNDFRDMLDKADTRRLGEKKINGREAYGFSLRTGRDRLSNPHWRPADLWIDAKSKRLVNAQLPGPELRAIRAEEARAGQREIYRNGTKVFLGEEYRDIVFDGELDDSLFSFDVPEGYTLQTHRRPEVTEEEMVEWLGVLAQCNDNTFPAKIGKSYMAVIDIPNGRKMLKKAPDERTPAEKKWVERFHVFSEATTYRNPVGRFRDYTAGDTWRYEGAGVKFGQKDAVVCWYKPKRSKTYRVVYGDLSARDLAPEDLPKKRAATK